MAGPDAQIKFDAPAVLRKWPSLNNQRSKLAAPYSIAEGTLDECIRQFMSKPRSQLDLYEIHTAPVGEAAKDVRYVDRISHQSASFDEFTDWIDCGNPAFRRQFDNRCTIGGVLGLFRYHECIRSILFQRREDALVRSLVP